MPKSFAISKKSSTFAPVLKMVVDHSVRANGNRSRQEVSLFYWLNDSCIFAMHPYAAAIQKDLRALRSTAIFRTTGCAAAPLSSRLIKKENMKEIWKDVKDYEGLYQVSNKGRIRSRQVNDEWRIMRPTLNRYGYYAVTLCRNGHRKLGLVHRLVAAAFVNGYSGELTVDHINSIRTDNRKENLRWVTRKVNASLPLHNLHSTKAYREQYKYLKKESDKHSFNLPNSLDGEIWKDVDGYKGRYKVSNKGRVFSFKKNIILRATPNLKGGHLCIALCKDGKQKKVQIHRLVALAFVGGYRPGFVVNHIDENPENNCAENLEWVTQRYNTNYGTARVRSIAGYVAKRGRPVMQYTLDGEFVKEHVAMSYAAAAVGASKKSAQLIRQCCDGQKNTFFGFIWKWK